MSVGTVLRGAGRVAVQTSGCDMGRHRDPAVLQSPAVRRCSLAKINERHFDIREQMNRAEESFA